MNKSFKDRRQHLRVYRNFVLHYHEKGKAKTRHEISQVNNVSRGGLNFSSSHPLKEGAVVTIDLQTPFMSGSLRLEGVVLECKEKISDIIYAIRLKFDGLTPAMLAVLEKVENYTKAQEEPEKAVKPKSKG